MLTVPAALRDAPDRDETWQPWVAALPRRAAALLEEWELTPDGAPRHGECALVLPVRGPDGPAALKLTWPHAEAEHEHLALQHWHGQGAVRLLRADPARWALLLERASDTDLTTVDDVTACVVAARLLRRLHRPAPPQLRPLSGAVAGWTERLAALPRSAPVPHRLVEQAVALGRDLATDPATDGTLVHTDAHGANVLAAEREPWLVIDPKPLSGDPAYEPGPMLWNRWAEVVAGDDVRWAVRRRLDAMVDALELDPDRARAWAVYRAVVQALWQVEDLAHAGRAPDARDRARLTTMVTVAKVVQD